jgi:hypothetical protein
MDDGKKPPSYDLVNNAYRRGQENMKTRAILAALQDGWERRLLAGPLESYIKRLEIHDDLPEIKPDPLGR